MKDESAGRDQRSLAEPPAGGFATLDIKHTMPHSHEVRKLSPEDTGGFDEQRWPVNLVLTVLCGCVAGVIWAKSDFQSPVWYQNGYVWLTTLVLSVVTLAVAANFLEGRSARRLQLAALLSVSLHLAAIGYFWIRQDDAHWADAPRIAVAARTLRDIDRLPDYQMIAPRQAQAERTGAAGRNKRRRATKALGHLAAASGLGRYTDGQRHRCPAPRPARSRIWPRRSPRSSRVPPTRPPRGAAICKPT